MEVKPGYKQTEVGVIPEEWDVRTIRDVSDMVTVGFVGSMAHLFTANGVPLLRGQNVLPGRIDLTDSKFISPQTHSLWKKSALRGGDIVIVRVGYPGTSAVVPSGFGAANAASLVVVRPDSSCVDSDFMCCVLLSDIGRRQVKAALVGGAQQVINIGTAASLLLPVPAKPEQRAIATALSDVDGLLGGLDRVIAKKRDLKQAAMQQLLTGQTRLPGFHGEWEVKRLGDVGKFLKGSGVSKDQTRSGSLACVRYGELYTQHNDVVRDFHSWISPEVAATAVRLERVWVVTGPLFDQRIERLASGVEIPDAFYRIILDEENGQPRVLAFIAPQTVTGNEPLSQFLSSVREIERQTGLDFYPELPREVQERLETGKAERLW